MANLVGAAIDVVCLQGDDVANLAGGEVRQSSEAGPSISKLGAVGAIVSQLKAFLEQEMATDCVLCDLPVVLGLCLDWRVISCDS